MNMSLKFKNKLKYFVQKLIKFNSSLVIISGIYIFKHFTQFTCAVSFEHEFFDGFLINVIFFPENSWWDAYCTFLVLTGFHQRYF